MIHGHLDVPPDTPVSELPLAAIADLLERGDLDGWRPIAAEIRRLPEGRVAADVLRLLEANPPYGTAPLWRAFVDRCRARWEGRRRAGVDGLAALRRSRGLTQAELGERIGISQSDVSKLERRRDIRLSSLRAYVAALGGELRLTADSAREAIEIRWPE